MRHSHGFTSLEVLIGAIISIIILFSIVDVANSSIQHTSVSSTLDFVTRVVGEQGGVQTSQPSHFKTGTYVTSSELYQFALNDMKTIGIAEDEWAIFINGLELTPTLNMADLPYQSRISVVLEYQQPWHFISQFVPGSVSDLQRRNTRNVISSYHPRTAAPGSITIIY